MVPLDAEPAAIAEVLAPRRRILLLGEPGIGKSTLTRQLAAQFESPCLCISADPGSPAFGVPGAVALGFWQASEWRLQALEALCTLDAARFRLPLVEAVRRLARRAAGVRLLIDAPGLVRGVAGAEFTTALAAAVDADAALILHRNGHVPLTGELTSLPLPVYGVTAELHGRTKAQRAAVRTELWNAYLEAAEPMTLNPSSLPLLGTPPPTQVPDAWRGRQVALLREGRTLCMGEISGAEAAPAVVAVPTDETPDSMLVRDAQRLPDGTLGTAVPFAPPSTTAERPPPVRTRFFEAELANDVFGDPLLHVRLVQHGRSLLFDIGEGARLPAGIAHKVSDVFLTHAHMDHLGGFLWLLRSRIGDFGSCRIVGPPGTARRIEGLVNGFLWDRVGDKAPCFEIAELHGGNRLLRYSVVAGKACVDLGSVPAPKGAVLQADDFRVRAVALDHGFDTTVLAYALQPDSVLRVRAERLVQDGLAPGPWIGELKARRTRDDLDSILRLPDGRDVTVGVLAERYLEYELGRRLVYATDFGDTPANRARLTELARGAHVLICESSFLEADTPQATRTGHLTTRACAEIALAAGIDKLVPFHFSQRYRPDAAPVYAEIHRRCGKALQLR